MEEVRRALSRKFKLPEDRILAAEAVFDGIDIIPKPRVPSSLKIRERADRWVLATPVAGGADVLVTGGADLLAVAKDAELRIVNPRSFWELLRKGGA